MAMRRFDEYAQLWFAQADLSERTIYQRRIVYQRDIEPLLRGRPITDIDADEVRSLCERVKSRGAPATAVHVRDIIRAVFTFARRQGYEGGNPAAEIAANSIAVFQPRQRSLSPSEVGILCRLMEETRVRTEYQFALKLILLTLARRSELVMATWSEIDFEGGIWTIPPGRAKSTKPRYVYLSRQALDILIELKVRAGASEYVLPSMLDPFMPMSPVCLNHTTTAIFKEAQSRKLPLARFSVYDLRRTASTILRDAGFNAHWVELALAREVIEANRGLHDRSQYAEQLRHMLQEWADMVDAWARGTWHSPVLLPPAMSETTAPS
ncbi:tyrosine-type recombinase/integrase [Steroidobacter sp.]|uniref:tyrosine-type recombinase/integrase n=1 Tax=Steroidobacter sp. TaxID=1978227 RepID=UPI001A567505|nr:tyrosine-type recombinase/integrase [Steroidobacter sp.]MBL8269215.1 tyrosine-type recombinase/integrase [Steroidobacter sp.]